MCYHPVHIRNNSLTFDINKDKIFLDVPCGNCGDCRLKRQDDHALRLFYQYQETEGTRVPGFFYKSSDGKVNIKEHGYTYCQCFTYNEEMCPWLHGIKCFRPDDYRAFMVNIRNLWKRENLPHSTLKVYWVSEYGGQTFRPHYHALFFITAPITPERFEELCREAWSVNPDHKYTKDSKRVSLGWTELENPFSKNPNHTKPSDLVVNGIEVLGYVSEYVGKDIDFETVLEKQKNSHYDGLPITDKDYKFLKPFTRQSNGIGECLTKMLTLDELMDGKAKLPDKLKGEKVVTLPLYVDRKVFYDYNPEDKCFRLNEQGYKMKEHRRNHNRGYVKKHIDYLLSQLSNLWTDESANYIVEILSKHKLASIQYSDFYKRAIDSRPTTADCMMFVSDTLYNRMDDFVDYIMYYKDISSTYAYAVDDGVDLKDFAEKFIVKHYTDQPNFIMKLDHYQEEHPKDYYRFLRSRYGQCCERFKDFDTVLDILNGVNLAFCSMKQKAYLKRREEKARAKKIYKESLFHRKRNKAYVSDP